VWTWYLTRGSGAAALVLLTGSVVIGVAHSLRWRSRTLPRFVVDDVHRSLSLVALALVVAHVVTSVLDSFAPVSVADVFVPFAGVYRPTWLGFGAIAFDLMLILVVTSLWRARIGYRAWRSIHWIAWGCWPPAVLHTLGTGSDVKRGWMLALAIGCTAAVGIAAGARLWQAQGRYAGPARLVGGLGLLAAAAALAAWLPHGPLARGWARRAGTPLSLLVPKHASASAKPAGRSPTPRPIEAIARQDAVAGEASGRERQAIDNRGTALVDISLSMSAPERRRLDVRIAGVPEAGGGVSLQRSQVTFGPPHDPARYVGRLTGLAGTRLQAHLRPLRGPSIDLAADLLIDHGDGFTRGRVTVRPAG
jgi:sulfoxide reductase heme-binding subunit YedZ